MRKENFYERLDKRAGEILLKSAYKKFEASCLFLAAEAIEKSIESKDKILFLRKIGGGSLRDLAGDIQKEEIQKKRGNVGALVEWAGKKKKFGTVVEHLKGKKGIKDPERLTGWLKEEAKKKGITHKSQAITNVRKVIDGMGSVEKGKKKKIAAAAGAVGAAALAMSPVGRKALRGLASRGKTAIARKKMRAALKYKSGLVARSGKSEARNVISFRRGVRRAVKARLG